MCVQSTDKNENYSFSNELFEQPKQESKARQGKFIYKAQFVHKAIQSALKRRQIKSFHKKIK